MSIYGVRVGDCPERDERGRRCVRSGDLHWRHWPAGHGGETWTTYHQRRLMEPRDRSVIAD